MRGPDEHARHLATEVARGDDHEPDMEYQVAQALIDNGHEVLLLGVHDDLHDTSARLADWKPELAHEMEHAINESQCTMARNQFGSGADVNMNNFERQAACVLVSTVTVAGTGRS